MMQRRSALFGILLAAVLLAGPVLAPGADSWPICRHPSDREIHSLANIGSGAGVGCARPAAGSMVTPPADLYSQNGVLNVSLNYVTSTDADGRPLFCFVTPDGLESPTLHVKPGETLNISLTNLVTTSTGAAAAPTMLSLGASASACGDADQNVTSVNMHFHGTNVSPTCHSDEVLRTIVNSGRTFRYAIKFPANEPPGLYWYHPHIHGMAEAAVQGGASGAIIVDGIENVQPSVAGLPQRLLLIRDQTVAGNPDPGGPVPAWDVSLNYVPIAYPAPRVGAGWTEGAYQTAIGPVKLCRRGRE